VGQVPGVDVDAGRKGGVPAPVAGGELEDIGYQGRGQRLRCRARHRPGMLVTPKWVTPETTYVGSA